MNTAVAKRGVGPAMGWMIGLSIVLSWFPLVGGLKAGSLGAALVAVFLPGVILFLLTAVIGALIGWVPLLGHLWHALAGVGRWALSFMSIIPLVIGAVLGGATARD
jgi:hypothetical protein